MDEVESFEAMTSPDPFHAAFLAIRDHCGEKGIECNMEWIENDHMEVVLRGEVNTVRTWLQRQDLDDCRLVSDIPGHPRIQRAIGCITELSGATNTP